MLDRRIEDPSIGGTQDEELWRACGADRALLVVDLSGFTRLTKSRGILHFLTVYRRATRVAFPVFERHRGRCVKREADNLIYSFDRVRDALAAARDLVAETAALDERLDPDERVFVCVGIGGGRILELADDVFGDEVNVAFKLGEDVARAREILLSDAALARLREEGEEVDAEPRDADVGAVRLRHHAVRLVRR